MFVGERRPFSPKRHDGIRQRHPKVDFPKLFESPFEKDDDNEQDEEVEENEEEPSGVTMAPYLLPFDTHHDKGTLQTYPTRRRWSDLLLDISMTTTFNSLTNGTDIVDVETCVSYILFFSLVWWIWASQVCYDVRFTKADWVHRLSVFLQFIVFCALAAFTKDFDIGYQISSSALNEEKEVAAIKIQDGFNQQEISAAQYRDDRLPLMNAQGISLVIMFSRILLLLQYLLTSYLAAGKTHPHASPISRFRKALSNKSLRAFQIHIYSLMVSATLYLIAFAVLKSHVRHTKGDGQSRALVLTSRSGNWGTLPCDDKVSDAFVIILGGGLDKITEGFQLIAGNVTLGSSGAFLILAGAIIFIAQFSLYFEMTKGHSISRKKLGPGFSKRIIAWFIAHFFYFLSLITLLQAIAALLKFGNIGKALDLPVDFLSDSLSAILKDVQTISVTDFEDPLSSQVKALGLDLGDFVAYINDSYTLDADDSVYDPQDIFDDGTPLFSIPEQKVAFNAALQSAAIIISVILNNFDATPDEGSVFGSAFDLFVDILPNDTTTLNDTFNDTFEDVFFDTIAIGAFTTEAAPALWFYGSAGSTLLCLSALSLIEWWEELKLDCYRRAVITIRLAVGIVTCFLSLVDINQGQKFLNVSGKRFTLGGSAVWSLASNSLLLPIFSLVILSEQIAEFILILVMQKRTQTTSDNYEKTNVVNDSNVANIGAVGHSGTFDPYEQSNLIERVCITDHRGS